MRVLAALLALVAAAAVRAQDALPPPPPPPGNEPAVAPPPPPPEPPRDGATPPDAKGASRSGPHRPGTIGEAAVAAAGSQAAPLHPDEGLAHWRYALATGIAGRFGGEQLSSSQTNNTVMLYFGGQADWLYSQGYGQAARLRARMFTGGEYAIYVPSEGDVEAAYMIGKREFRFVIGRFEAGRYPLVGVDTLAQLGTLPCFEGSLSLAGDGMRLYYFLSPIEMAWVRYRASDHIEGQPGWPSESDAPSAASSARLRYTVLLPPSMLLSLQGDLVKLWQKADLLVSAEASLGYQVLQQTALFNVVARWDSYTRRGQGPGSSETASQFTLLGVATLAF